MKICVIGGANVDITAASSDTFKLGDSNPGTVRVSWGGVGRNIAHNLSLLGDDVELLTIFGGGLFGPVIEEACRLTGIGTSFSEIAAEGTNSFFVSVNNADGELLGGVADMNAADSISPLWLSARRHCLESSDAVVADANIPVSSISWLIDNCPVPLYLDAVSVAKAGRIREALEHSSKKTFHALKCNALEDTVLREVGHPERRYVSLGAEGLRVEDALGSRQFPAMPCIVRNVTGGGDALLAGIVHAGVSASVEVAARYGLLCARCAVESPEAVNEKIKNLGI